MVSVKVFVLSLIACGAVFYYMGFLIACVLAANKNLESDIPCDCPTAEELYGDLEDPDDTKQVVGL